MSELNSPAQGITRRDFVATSAALALVGCATDGSPDAEGNVPHDQVDALHPNILIIFTDQQRFDCLGTLGNPDLRTPNIDGLAADGVTYTHHYCPYPVCTPSRYSLLSGKYVHQHDGWSNRATLRPGTPTIPSVLKAAGYKTKAVGKMHFTPTYLDVGFEEMILAEQDGEGRWDDDYHRELRRHNLIDRNDYEDQHAEFRRQSRPDYRNWCGAVTSNLPEQFHSTEWVGRQADDALRGWNGGGHMLMASFIKPHHPFDPPKEWVDRYNPDDLSLPPGYTEDNFKHDLGLTRGFFHNDTWDEATLRRVVAYYYASIEQIDARVGKMIAILKDKGLYDDTLIVFSSDHGEYLGYHHMLIKGGLMYEPLSRVPLIIKYPGQERKGSVSDVLSNHVDLAPTILRQANCEPGPDMGGLDLFNPDAKRAIVFSESHAGKQVLARSRTRKLLLFPQKKMALLYDLEKDPYETANLYNHPDYQDDVRQLTKALDDWRGPGPLSEIYINHDAPEIRQPNVPDRNDKHREEMRAYFHGRMRELVKEEGL